MDLSILPSDILIKSQKELALAYSNGLIALTKEPENCKLQNAINNYKQELERFKDEIDRRKTLNLLNKQE